MSALCAVIRSDLWRPRFVWGPVMSVHELRVWLAFLVVPEFAGDQPANDP